MLIWLNMRFEMQLNDMIIIAETPAQNVFGVNLSLYNQKGAAQESLLIVKDFKMLILFWLFAYTCIYIYIICIYLLYFGQIIYHV